MVEGFESDESHHFKFAHKRPSLEKTFVGKKYEATFTTTTDEEKINILKKITKEIKK